MFHKRLSLCVLILLVAFPVSGAQPPATPPPLSPRPDVTARDLDALRHEEWLGIYLDGAKIGYLHTAFQKRTDDGLTYYRELKVMVQRLQVAGQKLEYRTTETMDYEARPPFRLFRAESTATDGKISQSVKLVAKGDQWEVIVREGDDTTTRKLKALDVTAADNAVMDLWVKAGPAKGATFTSQTLSLEHLELEPVTLKALGTREVLHQGVKVKVREFHVSTRDSTTPALARLDDKGQPLTVELPIGIEMRRETEEQAKDITFSSDLFTGSLARLDKGLGEGGRVKRLVLRAEGKVVGLLPDGPRQTVSPQGGDVYLVQLGEKHGKPARATEKEIRDALLADKEHPLDHARVVALAKEAVGDARTDREKVERLIKFVHEFIQPSWQEAGTTANIHDILQRKTGVCRHYALLFTTLARASGIPAREVHGAVYMGDEHKAFGLHAWAEVVLDGHWVMVDPALNTADPEALYVCFGAGRAGSEVSFQTFGKLSFQLVEVER
jgi:transglutaminase-like putative cysteine protease